MVEFLSYSWQKVHSLWPPRTNRPWVICQMMAICTDILFLYTGFGELLCPQLSGRSHQANRLQLKGYCSLWSRFSVRMIAGWAGQCIKQPSPLFNHTPCHLYPPMQIPRPVACPPHRMGRVRRRLLPGKGKITPRGTPERAALSRILQPNILVRSRFPSSNHVLGQTLQLVYVSAAHS